MPFPYLDELKSPESLQAYDLKALNALAAELRAFIVRSVSRTGGHLASNLGTVELTLALLHCFDFRRDRLIWDVGHQCYAYKILTGRKDAFRTLRQAGGLSGFPKREESPYDAFNTGHSSTALSAALGISRAAKLLGEKRRVIAVVGDGAMTGGLFYEALNNIHAGRDEVLLILNENEMSIDRSVGLLARHLQQLRTSLIYIRTKRRGLRFLSRIPIAGAALIRGLGSVKRSLRKLVSPRSVYFETLGLRYYGPIDGHDLPSLIRALETYKARGGSMVLHICTQKGRGYKPAERAPQDYHGVAPFDLVAAEARANESAPAGAKAAEGERPPTSFSAAFSAELLRLAEREPRLVSLTAAMRQGCALDAFALRYPERFFDVGIAEEHELCLAAGLAAGGLRPVVSVYATFLQRAFDQVLHDIVLQKLPVVLAIDRAGLVGEDGETHQGIYDLAFLAAVPKLHILCPSCYEALREDLDWALTQSDGPVAIRFPRGAECPEIAEAYCCARREADRSGNLGEGREGAAAPLFLEERPLLLRSCARQSGPGGGGTEASRQSNTWPACVRILSLGRIAAEALKLAELLRPRTGHVDVLDLGFLPRSGDLPERWTRGVDCVISLEEDVKAGGLASALALSFERMRSKGERAPLLLPFCIPDRPVLQASVAVALEELNLSAERIMERLESYFSQPERGLRQSAKDEKLSGGGDPYALRSDV